MDSFVGYALGLQRQDEFSNDTAKSVVCVFDVLFFSYSNCFCFALPRYITFFCVCTQPVRRRLRPSGDVWLRGLRMGSIIIVIITLFAFLDVCSLTRRPPTPALLYRRQHSSHPLPFFPIANRKVIAFVSTILPRHDAIVIWLI